MTFGDDRAEGSAKASATAHAGLIARPRHLPNPEDAHSYARYARSILDARARIGRHFRADLFADPAFDIMLDLFASEEEGTPVYVSDCARAARVPATTGHRYVTLLEKEGLVQRYDDPRDGRRTLVKLSRSAFDSMIVYLAEISAIRLRFQPGTTR